MQWSVVTIETSGGRLISIVDGGDPGDCDYYIEYDDILLHRELLSTMVGRKVTREDAEELVRVGLLQPCS